MSTPTDRDSSIERLLPRALAARGSASADACLDAETVAAWADGALAAKERAAVEAHAADCARCQALVAAMVATAPAETRPGRARSLTLGWLIPLTAAAAAAIIWVAVPGRAPAVQERAEPAAQMAEAKPSSSSASPSPTPPIASADAKDAPAQPVQPLTRRKAKAAPPRADADRPPSTPASPEKTAPLAAQADAKKDMSATVPRDSGAVAPPAAAHETVAPRAAAPLLKSEARMFGALAAPVIVSPDPAIQWRLGSGGIVQRSSDGGATWDAQQTGVQETLTAGASPASSVCWLAGPHGIVLLSTDGRTWRRVPPPADVALVKVSAGDDRRATVTAADGRTFSTADAGQTWSRPR